ncbi:SapC family protein [Antarcticirhabdus aurantiaca]|uniref:SapC family protein n=1 Tax=Antarcticirhabdus aurantiaca TaxID=2606717 RepID=A0ACD4NL51_9HYPH|nr:SapC family protein [Antarcticirhabdus aurantiaca]WAJ27469.1 SapC family protein [Jeongeuplla avenae]
MIAEDPRPLAGEMMTTRIYSPFAYPLPRSVAVVPVAAAEGERLAGSFPMVWRRGARGPDLVVLRSLLGEGAGFPPGADRALALLPLVLQAYPFVRSEEPGARVMLDAALPDEPTDAGATVTGPDGRPSRGTELRLRALALFGQDRERTAAMSRALDAAGLLEPWPLRFDLGHGRRCAIEDLLVVSPKAFATPALGSVLAAFGVGAARLLGQHRLSLFRAGALLAAAQGAVAADVARGGTA